MPPTQEQHRTRPATRPPALRAASDSAVASPSLTSLARGSAGIQGPRVRTLCQSAQLSRRHGQSAWAARGTAEALTQGSPPPGEQSASSPSSTGKTTEAEQDRGVGITEKQLSHGREKPEQQRIFRSSDSSTFQSQLPSCDSLSAHWCTCAPDKASAAQRPGGHVFSPVTKTDLQSPRKNSGVRIPP
ncbi:unnamed protein product [Rangifer tarandus platyrhynchus]|uniref:Uncharacterized protein n=1 Tax=Rangifer tarandus platyrhynchus TaxID=3082113 RepID=A0ABN8ZH87_RANTA|nr:unnamed protein product [Rangifer tarandus platyrhynchus]